MRFIHDCNNCIPLGEYEEYDLYYCGQGDIRETVIARYSDDGPDYKSGMEFAKNGISKPLVEAYKRAKEKQLTT